MRVFADIQSWWEVPSIAHFSSLFRTTFNLLDFDIEDLEEALLTDGTEETSWLQELIVRLLSGCLPNNEISTFNYQMFLRRLFRQKCQEYDLYNPFNTDIDFQLLPLRTKVDILHALCEFRLDAEDVLELLKNLEADSLRVEPLGHDDNGSAFWYFYGTRLYREDFRNKSKKGKSVWQVICFTEEDWFQLNKKFKNSTSKAEKLLFQTLSENFLPELPRLFREKERLARKRLLENRPRRTSNRLRKQENPVEEEPTERDEQKKHRKEKDEEFEQRGDLREKEEEHQKNRRREAYERRKKLHHQIEDSQSERSESRYEMAGAKTRDRKSKARQRRNSETSVSSRDNGPRPGSNATRTSTRRSVHVDGKKNSAAGASTTVGRQTNNSLASATGQIVIQPVTNPHRKKLKPSQVFRQTDEDLQTGMYKILEHVKNHDDAWPFVDPVDEEYAPNYYSIIRKPMDLQRMEDRMDSGHYKNYSKFKADFQLIVDNCRLYNGAENEYTEMVDNLLQVFERATERYLDQISSSDEEIAVEFPNGEVDPKANLKRKRSTASTPVPKRKPTLAAQTDKKRERSPSVESQRSESSERENAKNNKKTVVKDIPKNKKQQSKNSKLVRPEKLGKSENTKKADKPDKSHKALDKPDKINKSDKAEKVEKKDKSAKIVKTDKADKIRTDKADKTEKHDKTGKKNKSDKVDKVDKKVNAEKVNKAEKSEPKKRGPKPSKLKKKHSPTPSPTRSRSGHSRSASLDRWSNSPPPSWPPSSPELNQNPRKREKDVKKIKKNTYQLEKGEAEKHMKGKQKQKNDKWKEIFKDQIKLPVKERSVSPPKHKDKHNKLRETIEKLKAKSEISNKLKEKDSKEDLEKTKENRNSTKDNSVEILKARKQEKDGVSKAKHKPKAKSKVDREKEDVRDDGNSTLDSIQSEIKSKKALEALTLATEQTLKDINKWLDDTPRFPDFSSASNSPSHYVGMEDFDVMGNKIDVDRKKIEKPPAKKENISLKDVKKKPFHRDPTKFFKRREVQRTIDRLQPGKSKGNLLSNVQNANKPDELFPLGPLSKIKDPKNSLIVKTDDNAPKLSLGSVLDSFGKHKFVDDQKKEEAKSEVKQEESPTKLATQVVEDTVKAEEKIEVKPESTSDNKKGSSPGKATPNLSAWFKAFGAPKVQPTQKKPEAKVDVKSEVEKEEVKPKEEPRKVEPALEASPNPESPHGQAAPRQRKLSTGSSMSERSSFSQDLDSPRVGIEERLGVYPAPYPSPLHKSPSGASPVMASPRPDVSPKAASYPTFNGQIRVGFYQDTVSTKSSPEKSCSPRDNPQSPYTQYSEHVYTPPTTQTPAYSYNNTAYYSQTPNYSSSNPTPPYNPENSTFYDTSKPLTDQYQAKTIPNYVNSPISNPHHTPSPIAAPQQLSPNLDSYQQPPEPTKVPEKTMFPVKKRVYSETESLVKNNRFEMEQQQQEQLQYSSNMDHLVAQQINTVPPSQPSPLQTTMTREPPKYISPDSRTSENQTQDQENLRNNYAAANTYNYAGNSGYSLNIPSGRQMETEKKLDMSKYTNMGYSAPEMGFGRNPQQYTRPDLSYNRSNAVQSPNEVAPQVTPVSAHNLQAANMGMRYTEANLINMGYKGMNTQQTSHLGHMGNPSMQQQTREAPQNVTRLPQSLDVPSGYKPAEMSSIPRAAYSSAEMEQSFGLRGNLSNLTHIVDRYQSDERMLSGLQGAPSPYYADKNMAAQHMFSKPMATSSSGLPMFSQSNMAMPYSHSMQPTSTGMYNRPMELQATNIISQDKNVNMQQPTVEKKSKRRKTSKTGTPPISSMETASTGAANQGFQSYAGLKGSSVEPSAISLKTASVVPGSAFNFGPTPPGLGLSSGLYGDKDAYPNFLDDLRSAPNYYMAAAAAAHHRSTPEATEKPVRAAHQQNPSQANYPFIGAPQPRPPSYPLGAPFMPPHQAQLMDPSSPLYQQYLLQQGLLAPPGAYPPGYHPALSMRQPYDTMTRPSWL